MSGPEAQVSVANLDAVLGGRILRIDHLAIAVEDLESTVAWYRRIGFAVSERRLTEGQRTAMLSAVLTCGDCVLVVIQGTSEDSQATRFVREFGPGVQHVALQVDNLVEVVAALEQVGAEIDTPMVEGDGVKQLFLKRDARSGVRIELIEKSGGTFSDHTVERLFLTFEQRDLY